MSHSVRKKRLIAAVCFAFILSASLTACGKPTKVASSEATTNPKPETITWTIHSDCSLCHSLAAKSAKDSKMLVSAHAESGVVKCSTCHDKVTLEKAHTGVMPVKQVTPNDTVSTELCIKCHGSLADMAKVTANSTALKDTEGRVINPHAVPQSAAHDQGGVTVCTNCHEMHEEADTGKLCYTCHHAGIFTGCTCHGNE